MLLLEALAERLISDAAERGEFDARPGAGRALDLEEDPLVPEDMRLANRVLNGAGIERGEIATRAALLERARADGRYFSRIAGKLAR